MRHVISLLIENEAGALSRVSGLFSARAYNIESLTVAPTEDASMSRMTIVTTGSDDIIEQITKQLNKLIEVLKVVDISEAAHLERELMLVKVPSGDGRYRYAYPLEKSMVFSKNRMTRMFQDSVTGIDHSENIIVIKTLPGTANAVASTLDYAKWPEIIGTVAGDDNILVVIKPKEAVPKIIKKLEMMIV